MITTIVKNVFILIKETTMKKIISAIALSVATTTSVFAACSADIDMNNNKILNLGTPTASNEAANKGYVDGTSDSSTTFLNGWTGIKISWRLYDTFCIVNANGINGSASTASKLFTLPDDCRPETNTGTAGAANVGGWGGFIPVNINATGEIFIDESIGSDASNKARTDITEGRFTATLIRSL